MNTFIATGERHLMRQLNGLLFLLLVLFGASLGTKTAARGESVYIDPVLQTQLATLGSADQVQAVVNFDPAVARGALLVSAIQNLGAGTVIFHNLDSVGILATADQINAVAALSGVSAI